MYKSSYLYMNHFLVSILGLMDSCEYTHIHQSYFDILPPAGNDVFHLCTHQCLYRKKVTFAILTAKNNI